MIRRTTNAVLMLLVISLCIGCAHQDDALAGIRVANNQAVKLLRDVKVHEEDTVTEEARVGMAKCTQIGKYARVQCRVAAVEAAVANQKLRDQAITRLVTVQRLIGNLVRAADAEQDEDLRRQLVAQVLSYLPQFHDLMEQVKALDPAQDGGAQ